MQQYYTKRWLRTVCPKNVNTTDYFMSQIRIPRFLNIKCIAYSVFFAIVFVICSLWTGESRSRQRILTETSADEHFTGSDVVVENGSRFDIPKRRNVSALDKYQLKEFHRVDLYMQLRKRPTVTDKMCNTQRDMCYIVNQARHNHLLLTELQYESRTNEIQSYMISKDTNKSEGYQFVYDNYAMSNTMEYVKLMITESMAALDSRVDDYRLQFLMIGLGGGTIAMAIRRIFPNANVTVVELDPLMLAVAEKWFHFQQTDTMRVVIEDGVTFLAGAANAEQKYDAIFLDASYSGEGNGGLIVPVQAFTTDKVISNMYRSLSANDKRHVSIKEGLGCVVVNILAYKEKTRRWMIGKFRRFFPTIYLRAGMATLNWVIVATKR